jgi:carboxypeptidase family protein
MNSVSCARSSRRTGISLELISLAAISLLVVATSLSAWAQSTISTGSIVGMVTDPSGAIVSGAKVSISSKATGQIVTTTSNAGGNFSAGLLKPGDFVVRVEASGFKTTELPVVVRVDSTVSASVKLQLGQASEVVEVTGSEVVVNTEQATVQGVLTASQIENLPVNGRNFLDLAQLEPGVQIQDGANFDPTKVGYSSISFGGRFGRTARIEVDGVDVSDETVGTTTEDIPASSIQEFSIAQSSLDLSNELTTSGAVNVVTKTGTNQYHGEAFGLFRDSSMGASLPHAAGQSAPYQRNQEGGNFGGALIKNKLFFFGDGERTLQHLQSPVSLPAPFTSADGSWTEPFLDDELLGRLDYQLTKTARLFGRFSYFHNLTDNTFATNSYQVYKNVNYTRNTVVGVDFNTGSFTHVVRFSFLKFQNILGDAVVGSHIPFSNLPTIGVGPLAVGPNLLAPQSTPQSNHQLKYDGSKAIGNHVVRFGAAWNHIQGGGFAGFFSISPQFLGNVGSAVGTLGGNTGLYAPCQADPSTCPFPGGASNPLNYALAQSIISNGQGYSTEIPALGFPAGGLGPDNRMAFYIGDSWKIRRNLTISPGLRWVRDTGRTDSDLGANAAINSAFPGWGNAVHQANTNFAPQLGIAWDPRGNGKTVIRAGAGLFYENVIYNNVLFDRPLRLQKGAFLQFSLACLNGAAQNVPGVPPFSSQGNCADGAGNALPIGQAAGPGISIEHQFEAAQPFNLNAPNGGYVGNFLTAGANVPVAMFGPNYKTPRSVQMNLGIQHELRHGLVLSADYLRNVETRTLLGPDINQIGNVKYFNATSAADAINATNASVGCGPGMGGVDCAIAKGATLHSYTSNGLGSSVDTGAACPKAGLAWGCAFGGVNPKYGTMPFLQPIGRSVYNALQTKLVWNTKTPFRGVKTANFQLSYSLSRFVDAMGFQGNAPAANPAGVSDQDFVLAAADNDHPLRYMGPSLLDRTHQLSFGGNFDVPGGFRLGIVSHFYSPLSSPVIIGNTGTSGQIFQTDFTGSGVYSAPMPGTTNGSFGRDFGVSGLNAAITHYNSTYAGKPTPAGQALVNAGLMNATQLAQLGAVAPIVNPAPANQLPFTWLKALDFNVSWPHTFHERWTVAPSVAFFNVFNFSNFNLPPGSMNGWITASTGSINSIPQSVPPGGTSLASDSYRLGLGTGVFALGAPRAVEFGLRVSF